MSVFTNKTNGNTFKNCYFCRPNPNNLPRIYFDDWKIPSDDTTGANVFETNYYGCSKVEWPNWREQPRSNFIDIKYNYKKGDLDCWISPVIFENADDARGLFNYIWGEKAAVVYDNIDFWCWMPNRLVLRTVALEGLIPKDINYVGIKEDTSSWYGCLISDITAREESLNTRLLLTQLVTWRLNRNPQYYDGLTITQLPELYKTIVIKAFDIQNRDYPLTVIHPITEYIQGYLGGAKTKTYTNSTWSTKKTFYIKVTFSKKSASTTNPTGNVVNYEPMLREYIPTSHIRLYNSQYHWVLISLTL